jgi:AcrR family transcriptional regulator
MAASGTERTPTARDRDGGVEWAEVPVSVRAAVDRALSRHQKDALDEVEQILDAALRVAARVAPGEPKVSEIVAEAGTSNQTFYRYFAGKNDLLHAVMERGIVRMRSYLRHQMDKHGDPAAQVTAWIEGLIAQVARPAVARQSIAISRLTPPAGGSELDNHLGDLLIAPLAAAGRPHPALDARTISDAVVGMLRRHIAAGTEPDDVERRHVVAFCVTIIPPPDPSLDLA